MSSVQDQPIPPCRHLRYELVLCPQHEESDAPKNEIGKSREYTTRKSCLPDIKQQHVGLPVLDVGGGAWCSLRVA